MQRRWPGCAACTPLTSEGLRGYESGGDGEPRAAPFAFGFKTAGSPGADQPQIPNLGGGAGNGAGPDNGAGDEASAQPGDRPCMPSDLPHPGKYLLGRAHNSSGRARR